MGSIKQNYANNVLTNGKFDATDLDGVIPNTNINDNSIDNVTVFGTAGSGIPSVASDPPSPTVGDVWYNTTTNAFKYAGAGVGAWVSGGNLNTGRYDSGSASQSNATAALLFAGETYTPPTGALNTNVTESYNGTSWTELNDLSTPRRQSPGGFGTQTSAICVSGGVPNRPQNESWDGTSWTELGDINTARNYITGVGVSNTSGLAIAGGPGFLTNVESWNGTSWTEIAEFSTVRNGSGGAGTQTAALFITGYTGTVSVSNVEEWDGSTWTEIADVNTARYSLGGGGNVSQALLFGGGAAPTQALTEQYNGTSWTELADLASGRGSGKGGSSPGSASAIYMGGDGYAANPANAGLTTTEEWSLPEFTIKSVTTA